MILLLLTNQEETQESNSSNCCSKFRLSAFEFSQPTEMIRGEELSVRLMSLKPDEVL